MTYSKKAKYKHERQQSPTKFMKKTIRTVKISHATTPTGREFKRKFPKGTKAIVGRIKPSLRKEGERRNQVQSILIPKKKR